MPQLIPDHPFAVFPVHPALQAINPSEIVVDVEVLGPDNSLHSVSFFSSRIEQRRSMAA